MELKIRFRKVTELIPNQLRMVIEEQKGIYQDLSDTVVVSEQPMLTGHMIFLRGDNSEEDNTEVGCCVEDEREADKFLNATINRLKEAFKVKKGDRVKVSHDGITWENRIYDSEIKDAIHELYLNT